jgi:dCMP deaminase
MYKKQRPDWHVTHMKQAELMADRSTCVKLKVGAVLVKDNRTISQGYNGVGPGCQHCIDYWHEHWKSLELKTQDFETFDEFLKSQEFRVAHKSWSIEHELHAEQNCVLWAAREGISTKGAHLYCIFSPCINCAKVIHMAGITEVYYKNIYESDKSGLVYLSENKILCNKI